MLACMSIMMPIIKSLIKYNQHNGRGLGNTSRSANICSTVILIWDQGLDIIGFIVLYQLPNAYLVLLIVLKWQYVHCVGVPDMDPLTLFPLNCFEKKIYLHIFFIDTEMVNEVEFLPRASQWSGYPTWTTPYGCWCPGPTRGQGISSHGIVIPCPYYSKFLIQRVNTQRPRNTYIC